MKKRFRIVLHKKNVPSFSSGYKTDDNSKVVSDSKRIRTIRKTSDSPGRTVMYCRRALVGSMKEKDKKGEKGNGFSG